MASQPTASAKNVTGDSATFTNFMRRVLQVPHSEIKAKLDAEKRTRVPKSVSPASASASKRER